MMASSRSFDTQRKLIGLRLGRFVLGPRLGAGGTASVYLATSTTPEEGGRLAALKVIHDHLLEEKDFVRSFVDEANLAVRMAHPNVVRVHEFSREGDTLFLAMEYLHGQPLSSLIERCATAGDRVPFEVVGWIGAKVSAGLHHAHSLRGDDGQPLNLVHRDVSPQNVFITYDGQVKLIDFGIARAAGRLAKTTLGRIKGKFSYMAPEQVLGRDFDHRVDVFALGATLYEAVVGTRLFAGYDETDTLQKILFEEIPDPADSAPDMPRQLAAAIRRALAPEAADRYQDAAGFEQDLESYLAHADMPHPQNKLAGIMMRLFAQEQAERARAIAALLQVRVSDEFPLTVPPEASPPQRIKSGVLPSPTTVEPIEVPATRTWPRTVTAVLAAGLFLAGAGGVFAWTRMQTQPVPSASAIPPGSITLELNVQPPVDAVIQVDGHVITQRPPRVSLANGSDPVEVVVTADGFETARMKAASDRDQLVVVQLVRKPTPPPVASADAAASAPPAVSTVRRPPKGGNTTKPPSTGSLVTEFPK